MIRLLIGLILGAAILFVGLAALVGGLDEMAGRGMTDDVIAAFVIAALMLIAGLMIVWVSVKAHRRRKAIAAGRKVDDVDRGAAEGTLVGLGMASFMNDDFDGDDGGGDDFGD